MLALLIPVIVMARVEDLQRAFALATDKYVRDFDNIPEEAESKAGRFRPVVVVGRTWFWGGALFSRSHRKYPFL